MTNTLRFDMSGTYKGVGVSSGLDRGLLVYHNNDLLAEEGMGLGACAVQAGGFTYFASIKSIEKAEGSYCVLFSIDTILKHKIFGIKSKPLTRVIEYICTNIYMKNEKWQNRLFRLINLLHKPLHLDVAFDKVKPLGEVRIKYDVLENEVIINVSCEAKIKEYTLFVMNELGGNLFDKGIVGGDLTPPPSGWQKLDGMCELYSRANSLAFTMAEHRVPDTVTSRPFWGREVSDSHSWAGFESEIICNSYKFEHYTYSVAFREVEQQA